MFGVGAITAISALTRPEPDTNLQRIFQPLEDHAQDDDEPRVNEGERGKPVRAPGNGLLIRDLIQIRKKFSFEYYRCDIAGFVLAWLLVAGLLGSMCGCRVGEGRPQDERFKQLKCLELRGLFREHYRCH
jgi:hypothetical protein